MPRYICSRLPDLTLSFRGVVARGMVALQAWYSAGFAAEFATGTFVPAMLWAAEGN